MDAHHSLNGCLLCEAGLWDSRFEGDRTDMDTETQRRDDNR